MFKTILCPVDLKPRSKMALKKAIEEGRTAITFDELYSTSKVTFAILNSLKTGEPQKL